MSSHNRQQGFHVVEIILVLVVVSVMGLIGFRVWQANQDQAARDSNAASVPVVTTVKDLDTANSFVDQINTSDETDELTNLERDLDSL